MGIVSYAMSQLTARLYVTGCRIASQISPATIAIRALGHLPTRKIDRTGDLIAVDVNPFAVISPISSSAPRARWRLIYGGRREGLPCGGLNCALLSVCEYLADLLLDAQLVVRDYLIGLRR
jgi:hypothetical protein